MLPPQEVAEVAEAQVGLLEGPTVLDFGQELREEGADGTDLVLVEVELFREQVACLQQTETSELGNPVQDKIFS